MSAPTSLTAFKREVQVGTRIQCVENTKRPVLNGRVRVVTKAQGKSYAFHHEDEPDRTVWADWPKAANVDACHDGILSYHFGEPGSLAFVTIRLLPDEATA